MRVLGMAITVLVAAASAAAQPAGLALPPVVTSTPGVLAEIPAGTRIDLRILDTLGSKLSTSGQSFQIQLAAPIVIDGIERIPAGALGQGAVVHAARARAGGKAGELILAARFIEHDGIRVPLRSMKLGGVGEDRTDLAFAVGVAAGVAAYLVPGGDIDIPHGTRATALTRVAVPLAPPAPPASPAPAEAAAATIP